MLEVLLTLGMRTKSDSSLPTSINRTPGESVASPASPSTRHRIVKTLVKRMHKYKERALHPEFKKYLKEEKGTENWAFDTKKRMSFGSGSEDDCISEQLNRDDKQAVNEKCAASLDEIEYFEEYIRSYFKHNNVDTHLLPWLFKSS